MQSQVLKKDELKINLKDNYLTIEGESNSKNSNGEYLHKNIARRSFIKRFSLADNVEVEDATFEDGVLAVSLKHNIPEEQKPKEIAIHELKLRECFLFPFTPSPKEIK